MKEEINERIKLLEDSIKQQQQSIIDGQANLHMMIGARQEAVFLLSEAEKSTEPCDPA